MNLYDWFAKIILQWETSIPRKMLQDIFVFLLTTAERFCLQFPLHGFVRLVYKDQFIANMVSRPGL